jgi:hypothetical protein
MCDSESMLKSRRTKLYRSMVSFWRSSGVLRRHLIALALRCSAGISALFRLVKAVKPHQFVAVLFLFLLSMPELMKERPQGSGDAWYERIFSADFWYQLAVTNDVHRPHNSHVAVVTIGYDEPTEVQQNYCKQRVFLGKLLRTLKSARPQIIVIDKFFSPGSCTDANSTRQLEEAIRDVSHVVPVVFGAAAYYEEELRTAMPAAFVRVRQRGYMGTQVILKDSDLFQGGLPPNVAKGLVSVNSDVRKIPMWWPAYSSLDRVGEKAQPIATDTLATAAVKLCDRDNEVISKFAPRGQGRSTHRDPFTSFLREDEFVIRPAIDVVCNKAVSQSDWRACKPGDDASQLLRGLQVPTVVVIGQAGSNLDVHQTVVGQMAGVFLQANYIESLLDRRGFTPVNFWILWSTAVVLFIVFLAFSKRWASLPWWRAFFLVLFVPISLFILIHEIIILRWKYYPYILIPFIVLLLIPSLIDQLRNAFGKEEAHGA